MNAIPVSLLNMTAVLYPTTGQDEYAKPAYGSAVTLGSVYIEQVKAVTLGGLGETSDGTLTMFFDAENSAPSGTTFKKLDRVVYDGINFVVRRALPLRSPLTGAMHHWEVTLEGN